MDIFTTQLTRVMPVPIKPANLKVKALLKESATTELKEDHDHLENHDAYFISDDKHSANQNHHPLSKEEIYANTAEENEDVNEKEDVLVEGKDHKLHLDIYI
jgi:hypothetical protein